MNNTAYISTPVVINLIIWLIIFLVIVVVALYIACRKPKAKHKNQPLTTPTQPTIQQQISSTTPPPTLSTTTSLTVDIQNIYEYNYHYYLRQSIMTQYEQRIFLVLNEIFSQKCYVIPQVHLSKLFNHRIKGQSWPGAFAHINGKSVDFVLLRKSNLCPLCAIELDDWTHELQNRQARDREVEHIFNDAKLPLIRFRNIDRLSKQEIVDTIAQAIK